MMIAPALKDDLYTILRHDLDGTVDFFKRYSYPDVGRDQRVAFIGDLTTLLEARRNLLPDFNFQMLKGVLEMATDLDSLPYLEDEEPNVLINEFSMFFMKRICLFKNSTHILDIEEVIEQRFSSQAFVDHGRSVQNYRFVDSKEEPGVQIADIVVGILGKAFTFFNRTVMDDLKIARVRLSPVQLHNLAQLATLIDLSIAESEGFAHHVLSYEDQQRAALFLDS